MGRHITSLTGFVKRVMTIKSQVRGYTFYRGHSNRDFEIKPSLLRSQNLQQSEHLILREIIASHSDEFLNDRSTFEQLVRAQHHGLPTRLLDVTQNPLVALYFACDSNPAKDGQVIVFNAAPERKKFYDSDTVSLIANLANLNYQEKEDVREDIKANIKRLLTEEYRIEFNDRQEIRRLHQFIRGEKPYFESNASPIHLAQLFCVIPKQTNKRILAQSGAFILFGLSRYMSKSEMMKLFSVDRITISSNAKDKIIDELDQINVNERVLFPEIDRGSKYVARRYQ